MTDPFLQDEWINPILAGEKRRADAMKDKGLLAQAVVTDDIGGIELSDAVQLPAGATIYGRWTGGKLADGKIIAYFGF